MKDFTPWMAERDLHVWAAWLQLSTDLPAALHADLQARSDLSLQDFDVLVQLTDVPDGRLRVTELADAVHWERSRLSHHLKRMEARGLVERDDCVEDGRVAYIRISRTGRRALDRVAPGHMAAVQELFFGALTDADKLALARLTRKMLQNLERASAAEGMPARSA